MTTVTLMDLIVRSLVEERFYGEKIYTGPILGLPSVLVLTPPPSDTYLVPFRVKGSPQEYTVRVPMGTLLLLTNILRDLRKAVDAADQKDPPLSEPKETPQ